MMDCTINNCEIRARVKSHRQNWYRVYCYKFGESEQNADEKQALTAQFRHEGDAYRYANILQQNPGYITLIVIK